MRRPDLAVPLDASCDAPKPLLSLRERQTPQSRLKPREALSSRLQLEAQQLRWGPHSFVSGSPLVRCRPLPNVALSSGQHSLQASCRGTAASRRGRGLRVSIAFYIAQGPAQVHSFKLQFVYVPPHIHTLFGRSPYHLPSQVPPNFRINASVHHPII